MPESGPQQTETPPDVSPLDVVHLQNEVVEVRKQRDEYRRLYLAMLERNKVLERGILFQGRERVLPPESLALPLLGMLTGTTETPATPTDPPKKKDPPPPPTGRKPFPKSLPRVDIEVIPPEVGQLGLAQFDRIGEDVSETIERRIGGVVVLRVHKVKFAPKDRGDEGVSIVQGQMPPLPIPGGMAGPALLAETIVKRWEDHQPLHRMERSFGRDGIELARSTICGWHQQLADLVRPLTMAMWLDAMTAPYLCVDATGVLVQDLKKCRRAHFFVVAAPGRHILFGYTPKHNAAAVDKLLGKYGGLVVADASTVYDHLYEKGQITECGCWAHTRRYFFNSLETDRDRAKHAIGLIGKLFAIEKANAQAPPERRLAERQRFSRPVFEEFFAWCEVESTRVLDETPLSKAIQYARRQKVALSRFLENGAIPIHNNLSERELRREAVGRKNWLFVGSDEGGEVNATFVTLIASCRHLEINPAEYLRDLFCLLPIWKANRIFDLAPINWQATMAREDVRQALDQNPWRRIALGQVAPS
jgi:transposase